MKRSAISIILGCLLALCAAAILTATTANAAERVLVKTTGVPLAVGAYDAGDTLVISGDALELGEQEDDMGDWETLAWLPDSFKLRFANGQSVIPEAALMDAPLTEIEAPDALEIGGWAFAYNPLTKAVFPKVESITGNPFVVTTALFADGLSINPQRFTLDAEKGVLYDKDKTRAITYLFSNGLTSYTAPKSLTVVGDSAFAAAKLTDVSLPNVQIVEGGAFFGSGLKTLSMPNAVEVGELAFLQCSGLTSLYLPKVETLHYQAFAACQNLVSATLPNVVSLGEGAFFNNSKLASISMPKVEAIGDGAFASTHKLSVLELGAAAPAVSDDAFSNVNQGNRVLLLTPQPDNYPLAAIPGFPLTTLVLRAYITQSPVVLLAGDDLQLSADIEGTAAPFQWEQNTAAIAGATDAAYLKKNVTAADTGLYAMQFIYDGTTYRTAPIGVQFATPEITITPASSTVEAERAADLAFEIGAFVGEREFAITDFTLVSNVDRAGLILDKTATGFRVHGIASELGAYRVDVTASVQGYAEDFTASAVIEVVENGGGDGNPGETCDRNSSNGCTAFSVAGLSLLLVPLALIYKRKKK